MEIIEKLQELEQHPEALDVGTDSFNDADDEPFDPTAFIDEDDEFLSSAAPTVTEGTLGGVLAHTDQHVVQRLMRAVQVGGRDLTDQLAIAS
ncbi:hypothetical protein [Mycobacterium sp. URHB0021]